MFLASNARQSVRLAKRVGRRKLARPGAAELTTELVRLERELELANSRARLLSDELGVKYAVFRCESKRYDDGRGRGATDLMFLSRQTDDCIQSIYSLEQRRRELLKRIGK